MYAFAVAPVYTGIKTLRFVMIGNYCRCFVFFLLFCSACIAEERQTILVTGGAGYIGTQTCKALVESGYFPVIFDNLSHGYKEAVKWGVLEVGDISDRKRLGEVIDKYHPAAVIHFAALKLVGESVEDPAKYYLNNVCGSIVMLDLLREKGVKKIIFSSSATTYDSTTNDPISEQRSQNALNPYGRTKWMVEKVLNDFHDAYGFQYVIFRYFNVAGADLEGECGERGDEPCNLIPIVLQVADRRRQQLEIFGTDYATKDGSCIRDFVHVVDLADAHVRALDYLFLGNLSVSLNLGSGKGISVKEIIDYARKVTSRSILATVAHRRIGDPSILIAESRLAQTLLGWEPKYSDPKTIIETEWLWMQKLQENRLANDVTDGSD